MYETAPVSIARTAPSSDGSPVISRIGRSSSRRRTSRARPKPSSSGMLTSETTQSKCSPCCIASTAARPCSACTTVQPSVCSKRTQARRICGSSSTTSTRPRWFFPPPAAISRPSLHPEHDVECGAQLLVVPRLREVAMYGAFVDRTRGDLDIAIASDEKPHHVRIQNANVLEQVEPVAVGFEGEIAHDRVERAFLERVDRFAWSRGLGHEIPPQRPLHRPANLRIVVADQDRGHIITIPQTRPGNRITKQGPSGAAST